MAQDVVSRAERVRQAFFFSVSRYRWSAKCRMRIVGKRKEEKKTPFSDGKKLIFSKDFRRFFFFFLRFMRNVGAKKGRFCEVFFFTFPDQCETNEGSNVKQKKTPAL